MTITHPIMIPSRANYHRTRDPGINSGMNNSWGWPLEFIIPLYWPGLTEERINDGVEITNAPPSLVMRCHPEGDKWEPGQQTGQTVLCNTRHPGSWHNGDTTRCHILTTSGHLPHYTLRYQLSVQWVFRTNILFLFEPDIFRPHFYHLIIFFLRHYIRVCVVSGQQWAGHITLVTQSEALANQRPSWLRSDQSEALSRISSSVWTLQVPRYHLLVIFIVCQFDVWIINVIIIDENNHSRQYKN